MLKLLRELIKSKETIDIVLDLGDGGHDLEDVKVTAVDEETGIVTLTNGEDDSTAYIRLDDIAIICRPKKEETE